jgi:CheY-like chemotaxis protein
MQRATYRIVLIDDDLDMHDVARVVLPPPRHSVSCATTAAAGLELIRRERPDLILLDIMLATPTEGFAVAEQLKADPELCRIPIVMISSAALDGPPPATAARFLEKPLDPLELQRIVVEVAGT